MNAGSKKDFFVSYNRHDKAWAEWIAATLEEAGYSTIIQAWDFRPGGNFVLDMHDAIDNTRRTIAVLSPNYLRSEFTQPEWAAAFVQDPRGKNRTLIPVRVEACELTGLLRAIVYVDLVGISEAEARKLLLQAISEERTKPSERSEFPRLGIPANLPIENKLFVGREQALDDLHEQLRSGELTAISSIKGMGGIGKTELALQYALKHLKLQDYPGGVCWVRSREDIGLQIVQFAREKLGMIAPDDRELIAQVEWCWSNWQQAATLIVFDDVQAYADIKPFLPKHRDQFRVLLTTRKYLDGSVQPFEIEVLSQEASLELLRRLVFDVRIDRELETAKQVCEWLGYLPLGLELIGRYLARKQGCSVAKLWERLQEKRLAAKALLETETGMTASLGVTAAFELSWQELNEEAQRLAALLSLFALSDIPWSIVQQCLPQTDEEELEDLRDEQLVNLSLLNDVGEDSYLLHQLLREFFAVKRSNMPEDEEWKRSFYFVIMDGASRAVSKPEQSLLRETNTIIPHLKQAIQQLQTIGKEEFLGDGLFRLAAVYLSQGQYAEAEACLLQALQIRQHQLGSDHPDVALILGDLALVYNWQGRYDMAEQRFLQALQIHQRQLEAEHPYIAMTLDNLAGLYKQQGRYAEAEPYLLQSLQIRLRRLGTEHPMVAISLNNLAGLYALQEHYADAERCYLRAIEIRQYQFGANHPDMILTLSSLGGLYSLQRRYTEAERCFLQALEIAQHQLGADHPDVATVLRNFAILYFSQERYKQAEPLYLHAFSIFYERLGESHPLTVTAWRDFVDFASQVIQHDRTAELSNHPLTRSLLQQLQNEES